MFVRMPADPHSLTPGTGTGLTGRLALPRGLEALRSDLGPVLAGTVLPFALVLYLALQGGGYDAIVRSEIGIAVWWTVLLGAIVGILPTARLSRAAWAGIGLLAAFAAWNALAVSWSESEERTVVELARVATYVGVLVLVMAAQGRDGLRRTVYSVGSALAVVGALALLSRLHPSWFPADATGAAFESARARLNYPVNYWNGLAALMAIGVPLMLVIAIEARRVVVQALATAAVPIMALAAFYTFSRGGAVEIAVGLIALLALYPRRLSAMPTLLLAGAGSALLIAAATQRDALEDGLSTQVALNQGNEMLAVALVVCVGVGLMRAALGLAERYELIPQPQVSRAAARAGFAALLLTAISIALLAGVPSELSERWDEFKQPIGPETSSAERFESASGNGRYQYWETAIDAGASDPLTGIGPGTYEFYWAREGSLPGFVRDAHSMFFETYAELGLVGLILISAFVFGTLAFGVWRSFTASATSRRWYAAATTAGVVFAVAAAIDWAWELTVIPVTFLLLAGALLGGSRSQRTGSASPGSRVILIALSAVAVAAIAITLAGTSSVRASQSDVKAGDLSLALDKARSGAEIQPWAATPHLQQALVLELQGDLDAAAVSARAATRDEATNWRTWLVLSRIEAFRGDARAAVAAYREARSLNPRSTLFAH